MMLKVNACMLDCVFHGGTIWMVGEGTEALTLLEQSQSPVDGGIK